jgi:hypothetical protein
MISEIFFDPKVEFGALFWGYFVPPGASRA